MHLMLEKISAICQLVNLVVIEKVNDKYEILEKMAVLFIFGSFLFAVYLRTKRHYFVHCFLPNSVRCLCRWRILTNSRVIF